MKTKHLLLIAFVLSLCTQAYAQIPVNGTVTDDQDRSLPGVTITFSKDGKVDGTVTDINGNFKVLLQSAGTYNMEIRYLGFESYRKELDVQEGQTYDLGNISLEQGQLELQSVEVLGRARTDYNSDYSFSASKIAMKNKEIPVAISTVTKEFISDRQAFQLADAVKAVSSVASTGDYNHFNIRGITQAEDGQQEIILSGA